ncbi:MAG: bifunctional phosphoribosyl-AMP cyclohydrolase/phosphoribosyl-ATP diphosphatase HisIE [Candidatus Jordarchaeum sp.]|uniref:bifunctional phosphoribosyl-AMP cyclohydrolase/phosphoribosyl-ATP diphosphatase HisIE n=1 Tax=Candidatus Jordarchaeum sp. TaxID=2823881 RepID=UPI00404B4057
MNQISKEIMDNLLSKLDFSKLDGIVPAVVQDIDTNTVLMVGFINKEALIKTLTTGYMHYYSRTRKRIWMKGEESKHYQIVKEIYHDCDGDTLLFKVNQIKACCHKGYFTCFHNKIVGEESLKEKLFEPEKVYGKSKILEEVFKVIKDRIEKQPVKSYVAKLVQQGKDNILEKIEEESTELIQASKNNNEQEIIHESTDLLFHTMVLLAYQNINLDKIFAELKSRYEEKTSKK